MGHGVLSQCRGFIPYSGEAYGGEISYGKTK